LSAAILVALASSSPSPVVVFLLQTNAVVVVVVEITNSALSRLMHLSKSLDKVVLAFGRTWRQGGGWKRR